MSRSRMFKILWGLGYGDRLASQAGCSSASHLSHHEPDTSHSFPGVSMIGVNERRSSVSPSVFVKALCPVKRV